MKFSISSLLAATMYTSASTALGLVLVLPLALMQQQDTQTVNWLAQIELEFQDHPDKLSYCRSLQEQNFQQQLQIPLRHSSCGEILNHQMDVMSELLIETEPRCWPGWRFIGRRCRKMA
ncbi:uncharacterized protein Dana_GF19653 [Drosophila ananassae]|uniref:Uncharacterized protein n=1 Tax=Drosophila ananassae TaxID=7217 RepID=B3MJY4_DROAN|nr:uncharacterized protein LOC6502404 [Drosophila ananassae]EDV32439.2 uncharacterized protein Dana_GF19653 [Drosophila ananassae]